MCRIRPNDVEQTAPCPAHASVTCWYHKTTCSLLDITLDSLAATSKSSVPRAATAAHYPLHPGEVLLDMTVTSSNYAAAKSADSSSKQHHAAFHPGPAGKQSADEAAVQMQAAARSKSTVWTQAEALTEAAAAAAAAGGQGGEQGAGETSVHFRTNMRTFSCGPQENLRPGKAGPASTNPTHSTASKTHSHRPHGADIKKQQQQQLVLHSRWQRLVSKLQQFIGLVGKTPPPAARGLSLADYSARSFNRKASSSSSTGGLGTPSSWSSSGAVYNSTSSNLSSYHCHGPVTAAAAGGGGGGWALVTAVCACHKSPAAALGAGGRESPFEGLKMKKCTCYLPAAIGSPPGEVNMPVMEQ